MLAGLYVGYVIVLAKWKPHLDAAAARERAAASPLPPLSQALSARRRNALAGLWRGAAGERRACRRRPCSAQLFVSLLPALSIAALLALTYGSATAPAVAVDTAGLVQAGGGDRSRREPSEPASRRCRSRRRKAAAEEPRAEGADGRQQPRRPRRAARPRRPRRRPGAAMKAGRRRRRGASGCPAPTWFWIMLRRRRGRHRADLAGCWNWQRLEVFKMLLTSFFPLARADPRGAGLDRVRPGDADRGGGGRRLRRLHPRWRRIATSRTRRRSAAQRRAWRARSRSSAASSRSRRSSRPRPAPWCAGCSSARRSSRPRSRCSAARSSIERWVLSLGLTPLQFMILAQFIIFILGWPLEWTEIIVIFMPIFIPLLRQVRHRSAVLRPAGRAEPADGVPLAAGGDGGVLPEGRVAAARDAEPDLRGHDAVHGHPGRRAGAALHVPAIGLWLPQLLYK